MRFTLIVYRLKKWIKWYKYSNNCFSQCLHAFDIWVSTVFIEIPSFSPPGHILTLEPVQFKYFAAFLRRAFTASLIFDFNSNKPQSQMIRNIIQCIISSSISSKSPVILIKFKHRVMNGFKQIDFKGFVVSIDFLFSQILTKTSWTISFDRQNCEGNY